MIKVVPDDAVQAVVEEEERKYRLVRCGDRIQWEKVESTEAMEMNLLELNKRYLQQVTKENGIPMQEWFQRLIGKDGYSKEGGKILAGAVNWDEVTDDLEVRAWLRAVFHTKEEGKLPQIKGTITTTEFKQDFQRAKENTSPSPSGMDYTIWKCIAKYDKLADMFSKL